MKDLLYKRYWVDGLSLKSIGNELGLSASGVAKKMEKFGICRRVNDKYKYDYLRQTSLTDEQLSVVVGTVLGDGFLSRYYNKGTSLRIKHCKKQLPYLKFKGDLLSDIFPSDIREEATIRFGKELFSCELVSIVHPDLSELHNIFYPAHKKIIPVNIFDLLDELSLSILFMDDGTYCESGTVRVLRISTEGFSFDDSILLRDAIYNKFNVKFNIHKHEKSFVLQVGNKEMIDRFFNIVYSIVGHLFYCKGKILRDYTPSPTICG